MKRMAAVAAIGAALLLAGAVSISRTHDARETITGMIGEAKSCLERGETERAEEIAEKIADCWIKEEKVLNYYVNHIETEAMTDIVSRLPALIRYGELSHFSAGLDQAAGAMERLWLSQLPLPRSVL